MFRFTLSGGFYLGQVSLELPVHQWAGEAGSIGCRGGGNQALGHPSAPTGSHRRPSPPPHALGSPGQQGTRSEARDHPFRTACLSDSRSSRASERGGENQRHGGALGHRAPMLQGGWTLDLRGHCRCDRRQARGDGVTNGRLAGLLRGPPCTGLGSRRSRGNQKVSLRFHRVRSLRPLHGPGCGCREPQESPRLLWSCPGPWPGFQRDVPSPPPGSRLRGPHTDGRAAVGLNVRGGPCHSPSPRTESLQADLGHVNNQTVRPRPPVPRCPRPSPFPESTLKTGKQRDRGPPARETANRVLVLGR